MFRSALLVAFLPCAGATVLWADDTLAQAELQEITPSIAADSCVSGCETTKGSVEPVVPVADATGGQPQEDTLPALLAELDRTYAQALTLQGAARGQELRAVKALLDRIAQDYPASNESLSLALGNKVGAVDPVALDAALAELDAGSPMPPSPADPAVATVAACLSRPDLPPAPDDPATRITLHVELDTGGAISGMPDLVAPAEPDRTARALFQRGLMALDGCPGLAALPHPGTLDVTFSAAGVESLSVVATGPALAAAPAPTTPTTAAEPPAPPPEPAWTLADESTEKALDLGRPEIAEIQVRLMVQGQDPNGIDGVLGKGARAALASWQAAQAIPASGYLDARQLQKLKADSQQAFLVWTAEEDNAAQLEKASKPPEKARKRRSAPAGWYRDSRGWYCRPTLFGTQCRNKRP